jgi:PAS domain S-box-containing protein
VLYMGRDVTERKRSEWALRESEARYRAIFNTSADALVLWNAGGRFVDVNRAYTQMYGFERADVIGTTLDPRLPLAAIAERTACLLAALAGEERVLETTTLRKNGEAFDVELRYLPITHQGAPHVLAIARDITERKRAEATRQAQEERYRSVFDASDDPIVLWDSRLVVVDVNAAFVRLRGYARDGMVGRHWSQRVDSQELVDKLPLIEGALAGKASRVFDRVGRATCRCASATSASCSASAATSPSSCSASASWPRARRGCAPARSSTARSSTPRSTR